MKLNESYFQDKIRNLDESRKPRMAFTHDEVIKEFLDIGREADALNYINHCNIEELKIKNSELVETIVKLKAKVYKRDRVLQTQKSLAIGISIFIGIVCVAIYSSL